MSAKDPVQSRTTPSHSTGNGQEPIAIIGMGCRFPGAADVEAFWQVLVEGRETVGEYPGGRFPYIDEIYARDSALSGRIATPRGGFLPRLDQFDAAFFGISPREAVLLDPQQRLLLEVAWEALEDAGLPREHVAATQAGVFLGLWTSDYETCVNEATPNVDIYATTGTGRYAASGRLAYFLDVRGPNLTVDTACSSSLVAVHLACQSLLNDECAVAIAGGANVVLRPEITLAYSAARMLSVDARCKFGDASANGYVRSEGAGVVILKRLSQALADGDPIHVIIRGSAVNSDGRSSGHLVAPSSSGQEYVFREALRRSGVAPSRITYVEAHGTGTLKGDPVEIEAIARVLASAPRNQPCLVGSVKTNIGHTEAAAGMASIIKVALAIEHRIVPASLHHHEPNPRIPWSEYPIRVATRAVPWPDENEMPAAGVCGFGITGTNAHVVLEGVGPAPAPSHQDRPDRTHLFVLSGSTPGARHEVAVGWHARLLADPAWPSSLADLAYTAARRRTHHEHRLAIVAKNREALVAALADHVEGREASAVDVASRRLEGLQKAVFVFPGQGGQWLGMGRRLFEDEPVFRDALRRCDDAVRRHVGWSVVDELFAPPASSRLDDIEIVQPAIFSIMVALAELWRSFGVEPVAVVGHSMGEAAAAAVAGALSLDDGAAVICHRSRLMSRLRGRGLMAVAEMGLDQARAEIATAQGVWIAASNSPTETVFSGNADSIERLVSTLEAREIFCRKIRVDVASHSGHMDVVRGELEVALAHIRPRRGSLPIYSTTTGEIEDGSGLDARYWGANLRQPVLFQQAVDRMLEDGADAFVEVNAHPVLVHALTELIERSGHDAIATGSLRRDEDEHEELLAALGRLYVAGYRVDFARMCPRGACLRLPLYPWQRERYWFELGADQVRRSEHAARSASARVNDDASADRAATCLSAPHWIPLAPDRASSPDVRSLGHWVVLAEPGPLRDSLALELRGAGENCTLVATGDRFQMTGPDEYAVNPVDCAGLATLVADAGPRLRGVVHLWGVPSIVTAPVTLGDLGGAQHGGLHAVPAIIREITTANLTQRVDLCLVTAGVQCAAARDRADGVAQAPLWGLGPVVAREHPELRCTNVDLSADFTSGDARTFAGVLLRGIGEEQLAIRGIQCLALRYRPVDTTHAALPRRPIHNDATYLVTGGLGGLGLLTARWLVERGARHIVLTGRNAPSGAAMKTIAKLEELGASIRVITADVSDAAEVTGLRRAIKDLPPLRGIVHLAVATADGLIVRTSREQFDLAFAGKAAGAWNVIAVTEHDALDFCIFFSSIASLISQPGQGAYAAANAMLDALARYGRARGYPALSVQWGPWAGGGLSGQAGKTRSVAAYEEQGVRPLTASLGFALLDRALLDRALAGAAAVVLAADADWRQYAEYCADGVVPGPLASLVAQRGVTGDGGAHDTSPNMREAVIAATPGRARQALLEGTLRDILARVLKTVPARIGMQKPFGSLGVDSMMAMEFVRQLSRQCGVSVPATAVFNQPTIRALAKDVARRMGVPLDSATTASDGESIDAHGQGRTASTDAGASTQASAQANAQASAQASAQTVSDQEAIRSLIAGPEAGA